MKAHVQIVQRACPARVSNFQTSPAKSGVLRIGESEFRSDQPSSEYEAIQINEAMQQVCDDAKKP
jgi:hypothetical protein